MKIIKKTKIHKCKFCNKLSKTFTSNTKHMNSKHRKDYKSYINHLNENNTDIQKLDATYITNLTHECININKEEDDHEDDPELTYIENNKLYNNDINNLDLFADIAISLSFTKAKFCQNLTKL
jgi:hypothetical protein